jgi:pimeloyl-ACP methyl ester carboxylesterase
MGRPTDARPAAGDKAVLSHHDSERKTEMPRISASEVELGYDLAGNGETLVLVHGGWSDRNNWQAVAPELARSHRVVAYDRRGHGSSQRDVEGSRRDQEDDLAALIEGVGGEPAHVAGTSFGASIAIGLASRRPDLVRSLIAHEPPLASLVADDAEVRPQLEAVLTSVQTVVARVEHGDALGAAEQFVEEVALGPGAWELLPEPLRETMVDSAPAFVAEQRDPMWATVELAALANIECPLLLTQGDESPAWFRPIVAKLAEAIDDAEVHTYRGAGHAPHLTHPGDYLTAVTGFLSRTPERAIEAGVAAG